ncbi:YtxH domain-containing protein [Arthrobacter sp. 3Tela_A]|uniref:YtxH domain-containing protein n=1 Tax=Arthrobacter sp. 3Tela_A TaxID=3093743 RepID=UPI003BB52FEF
MVKKMTFLAGIGVGYLIGSKAGREKIMSLWNDPKVQDTVSQGTDWAKEKVPGLQEKVTGAAKDAASSAKDAAAHAKDSASGGGSGAPSSGSSNGSSTVAGTANPADRSHTSGGGSTMDPARPQPDGR